MNIKEAQNDMRQSYVGGSSGVIISGLAWLSAGISAVTHSIQISIIIFFFGGMLIFPLSILVSKLFKRSGMHSKDNPLAKLAMESTIILFAGLFIAYSVFQVKAQWFFPIMLIVIGVRYIVFQTIYGMKVYWILGMVLTLGGAICLITNQAFHLVALVGGTIELVFSFLIFKLERSFL